MKIVDEAYGDGLVMAYHRDPSGNHGDGLARFIAAEIRETFAPRGKDQIAEAIGKMETARAQIEAIVRALETVIGEKPVSTCPCGAPADCYDLYCGTCMEKVRYAADKALTEFREALESAPHDSMEEGCLLDELVVKIVTANSPAGKRRKP